MFGFVRALAVFGFAALVAGCSVLGSEAAPEPKFTATLSEPPFEVRTYPELVLVKTSMTAEDDDAFMRLFRYISGANSGERKIAMTAPVLTGDSDGTKIAMTAPVITEGKDNSGEMAFILTDNFTPETAPLPTDPAVELDVIPSRKVAVIRFSGRANDAMFAEETAKLQAWMSAQALEPAGPAEYAQYNPPWTVPALRRNEVMIPITE